MKEDIDGFIQFRSPVFMIGASNTVMVKLTSSLNCLCEKPIYNIIIAWKADEEHMQLHVESFLHSIDELMHRRVRIHKLSPATLFRNKVREFFRPLMNHF